MHADLGPVTSFLEINPEKIRETLTGPDGTYTLNARFVDMSRGLELAGLDELNLEDPDAVRAYLKATAEFHNWWIVRRYRRTLVGSTRGSVDRGVLTKRKEDQRLTFDVDEEIRKINFANEARVKAFDRMLYRRNKVAKADMEKLEAGGDESS